MIYLFLEQQFCQNNPIIKSLGSEFEGIKRGIVQKVPKTTGRRRHMRPWQKRYFCYEGRSRVEGQNSSIILQRSLTTFIASSRREMFHMSFSSKNSLYNELTKRSEKLLP